MTTMYDMRKGEERRCTGWLLAVCVCSFSMGTPTDTVHICIEGELCRIPQVVISLHIRYNFHLAMQLMLYFTFSSSATNNIEMLTSCC